MDVPPTVLPKNRPLPSVEDLKSDEQKKYLIFLRKESYCSAVDLFSEKTERKRSIERVLAPKRDNKREDLQRTFIA